MSEETCVCVCIPRCFMVLRETESVRIESCYDRHIIHGPNLFACAYPCMEWTKYEKVELFVNEFTLIENSLDPDQNRCVGSDGTYAFLVSFSFCNPLYNFLALLH